MPIEDPGESTVQPGWVEWGDQWEISVLRSSLPFAYLAKHRILDPEGLALGAVIASSKKAKRDLIDNSFNR